MKMKNAHMVFYIEYNAKFKSLIKQSNSGELEPVALQICQVRFKQVTH